MIKACTNKMPHLWTPILIGETLLYTKECCARYPTFLDDVFDVVAITTLVASHGRIAILWSRSATLKGVGMSFARFTPLNCTLVESPCGCD